MEHNNYDDEQQNTEELRFNSYKAGEANERKPFTSGLLGGLTGGVISALIVAVLFMTSVIPVPDDGESSGGNSQSPDKGTTQVTKTIASDDEDVSGDLSEAADAVVGVINLQQRDIWTQNEEAGTGSGIIYKKEDGKAYVVTNQHVVKNAREVEVALHDDERIRAKVLGADELTDLAILEIDGEKINTVAKLGTSVNLKAGETVIAIGNPLGMEFANSLTKGIISGLNRSVSMDLQADCKLPVGSSCFQRPA